MQNALYIFRRGSPAALAIQLLMSRHMEGLNTHLGLIKQTTGIFNNWWQGYQMSQQEATLTILPKPDS